MDVKKKTYTKRSYISLIFGDFFDIFPVLVYNRKRREEEEKMDIEIIAKKIEQAGGKLYLVGGALRDELLNKEGSDEDYCVIGLSKEEFMELFPQANAIGKSFEVFELEKREFALARKEIKTGKGHKEFAISTGKEITIEEDLARRDITINAMAKDVLTGEWIDPYDGRKDLQEKRIKATTKAFKEDPLRVYRVARIVAQTGFIVEDTTIAWMKELKEELSMLSKERVFAEFSKALQTDHPSYFFEVLRKAEVLEVHFKEIQDLIGSLQPIKYHPEGDSYNHTMLVVDKSVELTNKVEERFSALVHDLGKGITPKQMYPHHYGHDEKGVALVENLGRRIGIPNAWMQCGKTAAKEHMKGGIFYQMTLPKKVQFIERVSKTKLGLEGLQVVVIADKCSTRNIPMEQIDFATLGTKCMQIVNGAYIKKKGITLQGKDFAVRLHQERVEWMKEKLKEGLNKKKT